jgi:AraC-like DNA-binding protein
MRPDSAVLGGAFGLRRFADGMETHVTSGVEMRDLTTSFTLPPGISIFILLEGYVAFSVDGDAWDLGPDEAGNAYSGLIWSRTAPARIKRRMRRGRHVTKIAITLPQNWLDAVGAPASARLGALLDRHLAQTQWAPSDRAVRAAWDIVRPLDEDPLLRRLSVQANALTIVREAFAVVDGAAAALGDAAHAGRVARIRAFLDETLDRDMTLAETAQALGMSVTALQDAFRDAFDMTVGAYRRRQRLIRANVALRDDGASVAAAAKLAGYASAANFATAYSRMFGYPPSQARR